MQVAPSRAIVELVGMRRVNARGLVGLSAALMLSLAPSACRRAKIEPQERQQAVDKAVDKAVQADPQPDVDGVADDGERARCAKAYTLPLFAPAKRLYSQNFRENSDAIMTASHTCPPRSAQEHAALALANSKAYFHAEALEHANRAVELLVDDPTVLLVRGIVHVGREAEAEAEADLRRALELDADNEIALLELGLLLHRRGETEAARQCFERSVQANPAYILGHYHLAYVHIRARDFESAKPHCDAVLAETFDADMALCSGLVSARRGDHAGALAHLEHFVGFRDDLSEEYQEEIERALRDGYLDAGRPLQAASHTCLKNDGIDGPGCEDREVQAAVAEFRAAAQARASEGSYASAVRISAGKFAVELQSQAQGAADLDALVHPEIGVFVFNGDDWSLSRVRAWPLIPAAASTLTLARLRRISDLPKELATRTNELDCSDLKDGIGKVRESPALAAYHPSAGSVSDIYRLCDYEEYAEYAEGGTELNADAFVQLQRAALTVTHAVVFAEQTFEFAKIGERWYLVAVSVTDPENDACG